MTREDEIFDQVKLQDKNEPTKEDFEAYETVRESGVTNMFDVKAVEKYSKKFAGHKIGQDTILAIMRNYKKLCEKYPGVRQGT